MTLCTQGFYKQPPKSSAYTVYFLIMKSPNNYGNYTLLIRCLLATVLFWHSQQINKIKLDLETL